MTRTWLRVISFMTIPHASVAGMRHDDGIVTALYFRLKLY